MANFVSNDNATSLMNAINQKKDSKPGTITWAEWIALTDEQREGTHYIITNVPAKFSDKDAVFSIKDQTLTFTNKTATVADSRITADTYIFTFYHNQAVAQAAGIECSWTTGTVTFTVDENPSEDIVVDILCILPALATPPSEGGGHVIEDASGTDLPQEDTMQFADARVEDDATNGKTVVHVTQEPMTVSAFNAAADLDPGIYPLNGGEVLDDSMIMHDSTHTTRQAIDNIVESGSNNSGTYIKYADGTMICTKIAVLEDIDVDTSWGSCYESEVISLGDFAQAFTSVPIVTVTNHGYSGGWLEYITNTSKTSVGSCRMLLPLVGHNTHFNLHVIAIGRWK